MADAKRGYQIHWWGTTDVGMKRRLNEDVFLVREDLGLYLVADGMGGHAAGEVASRVAAEAIAEALESSEPVASWRSNRGRERTKLSKVGETLEDALLLGHDRVKRAVERNQDLEGMGTTIAAVLHPDWSDQVILAHVGDSRVYRMRQTRLELLTHDHSWVHEQVREGNLSEEAARSHPLKNVVTQALGGNEAPAADLKHVEIRVGDLFLLCSDGLNTMLNDEEIAAHLRNTPNLSRAGQSLVVAANERGGNDNITVVLLRVAPRNEPVSA